MAATILWVALLGAVAGLEARARRRGRIPTLGRLGSVVASTLVGRLALAALWVFVGLHLFARYTLPR